MIEPPSTGAPEPFDKEEITGIVGEATADKIERRLRAQRDTLEAIRGDFRDHAGEDRTAFDRVGAQHVSMLSEIGTIKGEIGDMKGQIGKVDGSVVTILQYQQQQTTAQIQIAELARKRAETEDADELAAKRAEADARRAEITARTKLEIAKNETSSKIWLKVIAAALAIALAIISIFVGRATVAREAAQQTPAAATPAPASAPARVMDEVRP